MDIRTFQPHSATKDKTITQDIESREAPPQACNVSREMVQFHPDEITCAISRSHGSSPLAKLVLLRWQFHPHEKGMSRPDVRGSLSLAVGALIDLPPVAWISSARGRPPSLLVPLVVKRSVTPPSWRTASCFGGVCCSGSGCQRASRSGRSLSALAYSLFSSGSTSFPFDGCG
jgi:hypothetical protein